MSPPSFADIGKKCKDLFKRKFPSGFFKVAGKFPLSDGVALSLDCSHKISSGVLCAALETRAPLRLAGQDIIWIEKWTTKNELSTNFEISKLKNISNGIEILYEPSSGQASLKTKNSYKSNNVTASGDIKFKTFKPEISLSLMTSLLQSSPLQGGGTIIFDANKQKISNMAYGIQWDRGNTCLSSSVTNNADFLSQIYLKLSDILEVGFETGWNNDSKKSKFCGVAQLKMNGNSLIKYKLESSGFFSMGYSFKPSEAIMVTLGMCLNTTNITSGGHEFGFQVEL